MSWRVCNSVAQQGKRSDPLHPPWSPCKPDASVIADRRKRTTQEKAKETGLRAAGGAAYWCRGRIQPCNASKQRHSLNNSFKYIKPTKAGIASTMQA